MVKSKIDARLLNHEVMAGVQEDRRAGPGETEAGSP